MIARLAILLLALFAAAPVGAQQIVTSSGPESVSVTIYRDPNGRRLNLGWLGGYALITETRTVSLPAGESVIRFEGVAGSILPVSAIVRGLPRESAEKNYDARLLSAGALVDASLGRQVHVRRTDRATGRVSESEAIIRSGPDGIVLQTPDGIEALGCAGLPETLVYSEPPPGLTARPTLAIRTRADSPVTATLRLSYLATQFDWRANYVATLAPDGRSFDLFAWLTLANGNDESFVDSAAQVVAGKPNRDKDGDDETAAPVSPEITLRCWPAGTTSDSAVGDVLNSLAQGFAGEGGDIVITGSRIPAPNLESTSPVTVVTAELEGLGDLKLYRIPIPVTVAANAQKQVALLHMERVRFQRLYSAWASAIYEQDEADGPEQARILIRTKNIEARGMGKPLPSGSLAMFEQAGGRPMMVGESLIYDTPVGQDVEIEIGRSPDVVVTYGSLPARPGDEKQRDGDNRIGRHFVQISNATRAPVDVELGLRIEEEEYQVDKPSRKLGRKNGRPLWLAHVPANGTARLTYMLARRPPRDVDDEEEE